MKSTTKPARAAAPKAPKPARGNMKPAEIKPLVMAARKAFDRQSAAGLVDDGETFDAWRHRECMNAVRKPGITACNHEDFRPLLAHFQTLAGDDGSAFQNLMKSGRASDTAAPGDTHESRRILAHQIAEALEAHADLAKADPTHLAPEIAARRAAIDAKGSTVGVGYLVWLVRQKTRRPDLQLGQDWQSGLADRCTARQLAEIRNTVINRINAVEGVGKTSSRNKAQRGPKAAAARSPHTLAPRPGTDLP